MSCKKVNFFVIGQPKSGTTSLYKYFRKHNEVFLTDQKQLYYFAKDHNQHRLKFKKYKNQFYNDYYNYEFSNYIKKFDFNNSIKVYGDITPDYFYSRSASSEIYKYNRDAKIILILREPLSFLKSFHSQLVQSEREFEKNFYKAISYQKIRTNQSFKNDYKSPPFYFQYFDLVDYRKYLILFHKKFGDNLKVVIYEDFKQNNKGILKLICRFLKIKDFQNFKKIESNISVTGLNKLNFFRQKKIFKSLYSIVPVRFKYWIKDFVINLIFKRNRHISHNALDLELKLKFKKQISDLNFYLNKHNLMLNSQPLNLIKKWNYDKLS